MSPYDMGKVVLNLQDNRIFDETTTMPFIHESLTTHILDHIDTAFILLLIK